MLQPILDTCFPSVSAKSASATKQSLDFSAVWRSWVVEQERDRCKQLDSWILWDTNAGNILRFRKKNISGICNSTVKQCVFSFCRYYACGRQKWKHVKFSIRLPVLYLFYSTLKFTKAEAQWDQPQAHPLTTFCTPDRRLVRSPGQRPMWEFENVDFYHPFNHSVSAHS